MTFTSRSTMIGAEPERELVDDQDVGLGGEHLRERQHLLLTAGQRRRGDVGSLGQLREQRQRTVDGVVHRRAVLAEVVRRDLEVLADRQVVEHTLAARQHADPQPGPHLRRDVGDGASVVPDHAAGGVPSPAMTRRIVDLPAPLVPSSASTSPLRTSKPTSNRICTWP